MEAMEKFTVLAGEMDVETAEELRKPPVAPLGNACGVPSAEPGRSPDRRHDLLELPIYRAALPNGKRITLLKTMLTSVCERNCNYCSFRCGRDFRRVTFRPEELANSFMQMHQAGLAQGLFLSSGMAGGGLGTQDRLIAAAEILRFKLGFTGYLHLKIMPGADRDQVLRSMQLADRVSVNLEAPTTETLCRLAPQKVLMKELLQPLRWVEHIRRTQPASQGWMGHWPSSCTQFVVGAVGETDQELLTTSQYLLKETRLRRAYYSRFNPVSNTPLEGHPFTDPWRTHRLYQAFFLLRDYDYTAADLPFDGNGALPLATDPKRAWADIHLAHAPVELNRAEMIQLLRIPGIGPVSARAIMKARSEHPLRRLEDLRVLGIRAERASPYILLAGRRPALQPLLL